MREQPIDAAIQPDRLAAWRAVEALRAGVPSRAAVLALGIASADIEDRFRAQLSATPKAAPRGRGRRAS